MDTILVTTITLKKVHFFIWQSSRQPSYQLQKGGLDEIWVFGLFSIVVFDLQRSMFVFNMINNVKLAM
jgi:hypothetical protein